MSRRIVIEEPCEHGRVGIHVFPPAYGGRDTCSGGSRVIVVEETDVTAEGLLQGISALEWRTPWDSVEITETDLGGTCIEFSP